MEAPGLDFGGLGPSKSVFLHQRGCIFRTLRKFAPRSILEPLPGDPFLSPFEGHSGGLGAIFEEFWGIFFEVIFLMTFGRLRGAGRAENGVPQTSNYQEFFSLFRNLSEALGYGMRLEMGF